MCVNGCLYVHMHATSMCVPVEARRGYRAGEMAQGLRTLAALEEDLSSGPSPTHRVAHNDL